MCACTILLLWYLFGIQEGPKRLLFWTKKEETKNRQTEKMKQKERSHLIVSQMTQKPKLWTCELFFPNHAEPAFALTNWRERNKFTNAVKVYFHFTLEKTVEIIRSVGRLLAVQWFGFWQCAEQERGDCGESWLSLVRTPSVSFSWRQEAQRSKVIVQSWNVFPGL